MHEDYNKMKELLKQQEVDLMRSQKSMGDAEFGELLKKLRRLGMEDGDLGYAHYDKLIDKLKEARKAGEQKMKRMNVFNLLTGPIDVWKQADETDSPFVRIDDLPDDLAAALASVERSFVGLPGTYYVHDMQRFFRRGSPVAIKYAGEMELVCERTLEYANLEVPVWKCVEPERWAMYSGQFVRYEDMPKDLAKAFNEWQMLAACPGQGTSYLHDFTDFMARGGRGWSGDFSEVVKKYR